jgi:hypothetical protein
MDNLAQCSNELFFDKHKAFKFMLSEDSQKQYEMSEELNFYTNQCLDECRRVGRNNGDQLISHFMDKAQLIQGYVE